MAHAFIMTFGITQPTDQGRRLASLFIGALLLLLIAGVVVGLAFGVRQLL